MMSIKRTIVMTKNKRRKNLKYVKFFISAKSAE